MRTDYISNAGDFSRVDFFILSTYQDSKGETRPCYLLTKKGCDMVANKMTGEKGVLFTAADAEKIDCRSPERLPVRPACACRWAEHQGHGGAPDPHPAGLGANKRPTHG